MTELHYFSLAELSRKIRDKKVTPQEVIELHLRRIERLQPRLNAFAHDFGYTLGGPIFIPNHYNSNKKKTFFFWSQEWRREKNPFTTSPPPNVPSDAQRAGNFSDICPGNDCPKDPSTGNPFPGNVVPIDPVGQALLSLIPSANTTHNGFPAVLQTVSLPETWREELIRVDHNITDNYRLTFRYIHENHSAAIST